MKKDFNAKTQGTVLKRLEGGVHHPAPGPEVLL
jgi:hypothetical protein